MPLPSQAFCSDTGELMHFDRGWLHGDGSRCSHDLLERPTPPERVPVELGCLVWTRDRTRRDEILSGVVIDIDADADPPRYLLADPSVAWPVLRWLSEDDLDLDATERPDEGRMRREWRKLAADVGKATGAGASIEAELLARAHRLAVKGTQQMRRTG